MERLLDRVAASAEHAPALETIRAWYWLDGNALDSNALPSPVYELRPMSVVKAETGLDEAIKDFGKAEKVMAEALRFAAASLELPPNRLADWAISMTHREVRAGMALLSATPGRARVICRTLVGLQEADVQVDKAAGDYRESPGSAESRIVAELREKGVAAVPSDCAKPLHKDIMTAPER